MSSHLQKNEYENRGDSPQSDYAIPSSQINSETNHGSTNQNKYGAGTDVMGEPVNPMHEPGLTTTSAASETHTPASFPSTSPTSAGQFPTARAPQGLSTPTHQPEASQAPTVQAASSDPYVQTSSLPSKTPLESIMQVFNKWSKKAEDMTGNVWNHLRTGPNMADTALGRIAMGAKAVTGGGIENVYRQTFEVAPEEHLLKTYACYLSTSTGPVAGTLYISSHKLAFCSDRPLAIPASPPQADPNNNTTTPSESTATKTLSSTTNNASSTQQQCYYKVMVPISQVEAVNPSENTEKKPPEKYVQVKTQDGHEFWFMGFVNYDKGVKNLQESLLSKATSPDANAATHVIN